MALKVAFDWVVREFGREAMEAEARIACSLSHANVVATRNADWIDGHFVLASDLARTHVYDYPGAWRSGAVALRIVRDVAAGLAHAHERRLMHRDVKPENVLVFADGHAAITDFGVSRFIRPESRSYTEAGTMGYMAPEQAYGKPTLTSDVFSLGLIAYELLTGKLLKWPFSWPPERYERFRAKVPEPLHAVLRKACAFDPADRYPSAVELHAALEQAFRRSEESRGESTAPPLHRSLSAWSCSASATGARSRCATAVTAAADPSPKRWVSARGAAAPKTRSRTSRPRRSSAAAASAACCRSGPRVRGVSRGASRGTAARSAAIRARCAAASSAAAPAGCASSCATARCARPSREDPGNTRPCPTGARAATGRPRTRSSASAPGAGGASARTVELCSGDWVKRSYSGARRRKANVTQRTSAHAPRRSGSGAFGPTGGSSRPSAPAAGRSSETLARVARPAH